MNTIITMHVMVVFSGRLDTKLPFIRVNNLLECVKVCSDDKDCLSLFHNKEESLCSMSRKQYCANDNMLSESKGTRYFSHRKDSCTMKWITALKTDKSGKATFGNKIDLQRYFQQGAKLRFLAWKGSNGFAGDFETCMKKNNELCCQSLLDITNKGVASKSSVFWKMHVLCTTGHWHLFKYTGGCGDIKPKQLKQLKTHTTWFVLKALGDNFSKPVYSVSSNGNGMVKRGDLNTLARLVLQGGQPSVLVSQRDLLSIQTVQVHSRQAQGSNVLRTENIWYVSRSSTGNHYEFKRDPYWYFQHFSSSGKTDISRWMFSCPTSSPRYEKTYKDISWFINMGWTEIFTDQQTEYQIKPRQLTEHIKSGHAVRVKFGETLVSADVIVLTDSHIFVQSVAGYRANARHRRNDFAFIIRTIDSSGTVKTYRPARSSSSIVKAQTETMNTTWFIDTKKWVKLFHAMENGETVTGSALSVREAVTNGGEIRVGLRMRGNTAVRYCKVDNIQMTGNLYVQATVMRVLKDHLDNGEYVLDRIPQWSFKVVNTQGYVKSLESAVGKTLNNQWKTETAEIIWFAFL